MGTKFMLEVNASAILTHLRAARRASVSALAKETGLSRQAVTRSLAVLDSMGFVEISAPDRNATAAGRPPQMVRFRAEAGHVLGVDVQPGQVRLLVADLAGDPVAESTLPLSRAGATELAASLTAAIRQALDLAGVAPDCVWHVSAAAPGITDPGSGHVTLSPSMPEIVGGAILAGIRGAVDAPVYVDNDVKLATEGERWRGMPHAEDSLVFIDWGERIGAGIVLRGELYRGASNDAGDLGYLDLVASGERSGDPDLGPFEAWVGTRELLRVAGGPTLSELAAAAHRGEEWALIPIRTVAARFAKGIAAVRSLLDPEVVVIGGDIAVLGPALIEALAEALRAEPLNQPRLELSALGADAIIHGAVRHCLSWVERERLYSLPV
ncbi:transcriptional regulator [Phytohabitans rumicis]|uniref:Transcriptional regulator n=1 Tax=Phytohabitans rumicis TaxID=1076125 RepID=A0A6V8LK65_9ACTN|nr:transcriptional regulator [Phytohabitans rumicis]